MLKNFPQKNKIKFKQQNFVKETRESFRIAWNIPLGGAGGRESSKNNSLINSLTDMCLKLPLLTGVVKSSWGQVQKRMVEWTVQGVGGWGK